MTTQLCDGKIWIVINYTDCVETFQTEKSIPKLSCWLQWKGVSNTWWHLWIAKRPCMVEYWRGCKQAPGCLPAALHPPCLEETAEELGHCINFLTFSDFPWKEVAVKALQLISSECWAWPVGVLQGTSEISGSLRLQKHTDFIFLCLFNFFLQIELNLLVCAKN